MYYSGYNKINPNRRLKDERSGYAFEGPAGKCWFSQLKMAEAIGSTQSSINRYENGQSTPPVELFRRYADYFDVSLDYIFARTDKPQGVIYEFKPKAAPEREEMRRFIEMCFDPQSPMNEKLKETLFRMMEDGE